MVAQDWTNPSLCFEHPSRCLDGGQPLVKAYTQDLITSALFIYDNFLVRNLPRTSCKDNQNDDSQDSHIVQRLNP